MALLLDIAVDPVLADPLHIGGNERLLLQLDGILVGQEELGKVDQHPPLIVPGVQFVHHLPELLDLVADVLLVGLDDVLEFEVVGLLTGLG